MGDSINPHQDADRREIWEMLVARDSAAFLAADWSRVDGDFVHAEFYGIDAGFRPEPQHWTMRFSTLEAYRDEWLRQAADSAATEYGEPLSEAIYRATDLSRIELHGERALARKIFDGAIRRADGGQDRLDWQTLYFCARRDRRWKITGFVGYLPRFAG
jgi:hypothetical protein